MATLAKPRISIPQSSTYWRSMGLLNIYRITLAFTFVASYFFFQNRVWWGNYDSKLYLELALAYLLASIVVASFTWLQWLRFNRQLTLQTIADIGFIVTLMYAAGGVQSGLGLLLVVTIASASLISQGRLALFYAAIATIGLLLEQTYQVITSSENHSDYTHAVMLSISCFATAWLAHSFGKRTLQSEALASQRGIDLENMAQINALITQEMQDGVLVVDHDFKLRHHNLQAGGLLGISTSNWSTQNLYICSPELAGLMHQWIDDDTSDVASGNAKLSIEGRELRVRFMPVGSDRKHGAVIFIEDWSQMQTQSQQVKLAALGRLTANIAHEIRNPLSAISHANQLLQEEPPGDPTSQRMLQIIADNVQRMDQMVKDVLELNRRDRTRQEVIDLEEFLYEFHDQFCQVEKIPADGFELHLPIDSTQPNHASEPGIIETLFDRRHLHQILWNVCRNGWRHSKQTKGSLSLSLKSPINERTLSLNISDDGSGVSQQALLHLFEPFFTTESTGTGLGLYIARELCEANGGTIQYVPTENASLFTIQLKRHIAEKGHF